MNAAAMTELRQLVATYLEGSDDAPRAVALLDAIEGRAEAPPVAETGSRWTQPFLDKLYRDLCAFIDGENTAEPPTDDDIREYAAAYSFGIVALVRLFQRMRKVKTYLVARFDVTGLTQHQRETLVGAVCAQAEGSYDHPTVNVTIEEAIADG